MPVRDGAPTPSSSSPICSAARRPATCQLRLFVNAYLGLGDQEAAFRALEQAYIERSNILQFLKVHPYFDPIRGDPRFADLVHRVWSDPVTLSP
jgi:hypothetical protein